MIESGLYLSTSKYHEEFRYCSGEYSDQEVSYIRYENDIIETFWFGTLEVVSDKIVIAIDERSWDVDQINSNKFHTAELVPLNQKTVLLNFNRDSLKFKFNDSFFRDEIRIDYYREGNYQYQKTINTHLIRGNHPSQRVLRREVLGIKEVFRRVGIELTTNAEVQLSNSGVTSNKWSDEELNDLMNRVRNLNGTSPISWNIWCFMAGQHESEGTQGVMFDQDEDDPHHRQGAAIFEQNIINNLSFNQGNEEDWIKRMKYFITIHEIGHTFNLVHSFLTKAKRWIEEDKLTGEEQYSFMHYPWDVDGNSYDTFFSDFDYKFNKNEVRFLRHAPENFVKMGGSRWEENHSFGQNESHPVNLDPRFQLNITVGQKDRKFEYLEPVVVEYSLRNLTKEKQRIDHYLTTENEQLTLSDEYLHVAIRKKEDTNEIHEVHSGIHKFERIEQKYLDPDEQFEGSVFIGTDHQNWIIQEPGIYEIVATLFTDKNEVQSNLLEIYVEDLVTGPGIPKSIIDNLFSIEMAKAMLLDGSRAPSIDPNGKSEFERFKDISDNLENLKLAIHTNITLAMSLRKPFKYLDVDTKQIKELPAQVNESIKYFEKAFVNLEDAEITLGKTDFKYYYKVYQSLKSQIN